MLDSAALEDMEGRFDWGELQVSINMTAPLEDTRWAPERSENRSGQRQEHQPDSV